MTLLIAFITILNSCTKSDTNYSTGGNGGGNKGSGGPGLNEVWIQDMTFSPASLTVNAGTTVKWTNKDPMAHTVTSDTGLFDSGGLATDATFSYTFATAGTYAYHCTYHTYMKASVTVN